MKVKICANCIRPIKECDCLVKVTDAADFCPNCKEMVDEVDLYCSACGFCVAGIKPIRKESKK